MTSNYRDPNGIVHMPAYPNVEDRLHETRCEYWDHRTYWGPKDLALTSDPSTCLRCIRRPE